MNETALAYEQLIERFVAWALTEDNIRGAIIIGSRARVDHPADEWSDLDVLIFANDPEPFRSTTEWVENVGKAWLTFVEPTPDERGYERRVLFEGGLDVDFAPSPVTEARQMLETEIPTDVADMIRRGVRVLVDKDGLMAQFQAARIEAPQPSPPSESEFLNLVNDFWYHTVWSAKHLRRGELWWAKSCCDGYLKRRLQQMLEWHTRASRGPDTDTWMRGRFLEEWADPRAVKALRFAFAHYDEEDVWRALPATIDLFRWLAVETAQRLGYPYPSFGDERATEYVRRLSAGRA
jgi:aminoglycoside 6-adenylyltransferase